MKIINDFLSFDTYIPQNKTIVIGLSGGPDSVFLLNLLHFWQKKKNLNLIAAHLDHQWRTNSYEDALFCQEVAQKLNIKFVMHTANNLQLSIKHNGSLEEVGRKLRRHFLESVKKEHYADYIALGHHAQDQQETFFIRLMRGATLTGLCGMKMYDGNYYRPLLHKSKKQILAYLQNHTIAYLTDPTNASNDYLRNRIRNYVIPACQQSDQRFEHNFARLLTTLQQTEEFLAQLTQKTFDDIAQLNNNSWHLSLEKLQLCNQLLRNRVILLWLINEQVSFVPTEQFLQEINRFITSSKSNQHTLHNSWSMSKKNGFLEIQKSFA